MFQIANHGDSQVINSSYFITDGKDIQKSLGWMFTDAISSIYNWFGALGRKTEILSLMRKIATRWYNVSKTLFSLHTVSEYQYHTPSREERRFLYFNHLSKEFLEQMIPHLKALI